MVSNVVGLRICEHWDLNDTNMTCGRFIKLLITSKRIIVLSGDLT